MASHRAKRMVGIDEIEVVIDAILSINCPTIRTDSQAVQAVGYASSSNIGHWRKDGRAPETAKWALYGLLGKMKNEQPELPLKNGGNPFDATQLHKIITLAADAGDTDMIVDAANALKEVNNAASRHSE